MLGRDPIRANIKQRTGRPLPFCHDRAWPGYPRFSRVWNRKTWVTGPGPVMTKSRKPTSFYLILAPMGLDPGMTVQGTRALILAPMGLDPGIVARPQSAQFEPIAALRPMPGPSR